MSHATYYPKITNLLLSIIAIFPLYPYRRGSLELYRADFSYRDHVMLSRAPINPDSKGGHLVDRLILTV